MNYLKCYISICKNARERNLQSTYYEKHHIFPTAIFGDNENLVPLSYREHYIVHKLLFLFCKKRYGLKHPYTFKMAHAYFMMVNCKGDTDRELVLSSKHYDSARKAVADVRRGVSREDLKGKSYFGASEEKIKLGLLKMSAKKTGQKINYPKNRKSSARNGSIAKNISIGRKNTKYKYINMSDDEFNIWVSNQKPQRKDGRPNPNITYARKVRNEYYESIRSDGS